MTGPRNREDAYVHLAAQLDGPASAAAAASTETLRAMLEELREPSETARNNRPLGTGTLPPFARRPHTSTEDHDSRSSDDNRRHLANRSRSTGSDTVANYPGLVSWNDEHDLLEPTSPLFRGNRGRVARPLPSRVGRLPVGSPRHDRRDVRRALGGSRWYGGCASESSSFARAGALAGILSRWMAS